MLDLQPTPEPEWMRFTGLKHPVGLYLRPADTVMLTAGRTASRKAAEAGETDADIDFAFLAGCVVWGLIEWEGIGEGGQPAPITVDTVSRLMRQNTAIHDRLDRDYLIPILLREMEKNASAPSLNGISAGAPITVTPPVGVDASPALTTSKPRKPSKVKKSGTSSGDAKAS